MWFNKIAKSAVLVLWLLFLSQTIQADSPAPPTSFKKTSANGEFVFIMLAQDRHYEGYTHSGLYRNDGSRTPIWRVDWYAHDVEISSDGIHLIRPGPWASNYGDEAATFFANGIPLNSYTINDLVHFPWLMPRSVSHFTWREHEDFDDAALKYTINTFHGERYIFDAATGKIISSFWVFLWLLIFSPPVLVATRIFISKHVFLACTVLLGIIAWIIIGGFAALVICISLWITGTFSASFFDPSFPWSIPSFRKVNNISRMSKTAIFLSILTTACVSLVFIRFLFPQQFVIDRAPRLAMAAEQHLKHLYDCQYAYMREHGKYAVSPAELVKEKYCNDNQWGFEGIIVHVLSTEKNNLKMLAYHGEGSHGFLINNEGGTRKVLKEDFDFYVKESIESLIATLDHASKRVRMHAVLALSCKNDPIVTDSFIKVLKDEKEPSIRLVAVDHLSLAGDKRAHDALFDTLKDVDKNVRLKALSFVSKLGGKRTALALINTINDEDISIRQKASQYLMQSTETVLSELKGEPALAYIIEALEDRDAVIRQNAAGILGKIGDDRPVAPLIGALVDNDPKVRSQAALALKKIYDDSITGPWCDALDNEKNIKQRRYTVARSTWKNKETVASLIAVLEKDDDPMVRRNTARALGWINDSKALQALNAALKDCDDSVRYAAAKALGDMGDSRAIEPLAIDLQIEKNCSAAIALSKIRDPQAIRKLISAEAVAKGHPEQCIRKALRKIEKNPYMVEPLILLLDDESKKVRYWAISALGLIRDSRAVDALIASIKKEKRGPAVWALGNIGDVRAVEPLIDILDDKSSHVRYSAAKALGRLEDPRAVESLIRSLRDSSSNLRVRSNAVEALGKIGGRRAREVLIDLLGPDRIGILAACALGELKDEQALEPLITALEDPNKWHRMWAAEALGNLNDRRAASALISVLKHDTDTIVRMKSVQALGKIKDKSAFKPLTEVLGEKGRSVKESAISALISIDPDNAVEPLINALPQKDTWIRNRMVFALGEIMDRRAVEPLIKTLKEDTSYRVRGEAALALGKINDERAIVPLNDASIQDFNKNVRRHAVSAMEMIKGQGIKTGRR